MALKQSIRLRRRTARIRCKLGCEKRRFRSRRGFCLPASEGRSLWLSTLNPSSSTARLASSKWNSIGSKKVWDQPVSGRRTWVNVALEQMLPSEPTPTTLATPTLTTPTTTGATAPTGQPQAARVASPSVRAQCALADVSRATVYARTRPVETGATDLVLCQLYRRAIHRAAVLWHPAHGAVSARSRAHRQ